MAKQRNEDTIQKIRSAARQIFFEEGYSAASYSELALRTGIPRTTIQHYVPRKDILVTEYMEDIANLSVDLAISLVPQGHHPLAAMFLAGQISLGAYYSVPGLRQLLLEVATNRDLQNHVAPPYDTNQASFLGYDIASLTTAERDTLRFSLEGVYGIHYACINEGRVPNLAWLNKTFCYALGEVINLSREECDAILDPFSLTQEEQFAFGAQIIKQLH